jgi:hypothetical protein
MTRGYAAKFQLSNNKLLQAAKGLQLNTAVDYEYVQNKFKPLERLRTVEFSRDWGLPLLFKPQRRNIFRASAGIKNKTGNALNYQFVNYHRSDNYNGFQNTLQHTTSWKGWKINDQFAVTSFYSCFK